MKVEFNLTYTQKMVLLKSFLEEYKGTPLKSIFLQHVKEKMNRRGMDFFDFNSRGGHAGKEAMNNRSHALRADEYNRKWFDNPFDGL